MKKKCFNCKRIKLLDDFYKHKQMKDGRLNKCKECIKFDVRKNRSDNIEYYREYDKKRASLPHRVEARKEYALTDAGKKASMKSNKKYREKNPIKYNAHCMVNNAIRDGDLIKKDVCENCRDTNKQTHGHHDDYSKTLIVRWLCHECHSDWHRDNGEGLNG